MERARKLFYFVPKLDALFSGTEKLKILGQIRRWVGPNQIEIRSRGQKVVVIHVHSVFRQEGVKKKKNRP